MANKFPRVESTITVKKREPVAIIDNPRVPVLFMAVVTDRGPFEITKVRSITEFQNLYGSLDYDKQGQDAINIYEWLENGYAWIKRVDPIFSGTDSYKEKLEDLKESIAVVTNGEEGNNKIEFEFKSTSKDPVYKNYAIEVKQRKIDSSKKYSFDNSNFEIIVYEGNRTLDIIRSIKISKADNGAVIKIGDYFNLTVTIGSGGGVWADKRSAKWFSANKVNPSFGEEGNHLKGLEGSNITDVFEAIEGYYKHMASIELEEKLSYPISIILDGNYPKEIKNAIVDFIGNVRNDIMFIATEAIYKKEEDGNKIEEPLVLTTLSNTEYDSFSDLIKKYDDILKYGSVATYASDFLRIERNNKYLNVSSIYELAYKIPYNDYYNGIWWNFTGFRRGAIRPSSEVLRTNTRSDKNNYVDKKLNYIEKTDRDQAFMLQTTHANENTAHVELHAARLTQYIRRELSWIGRKYLFEFNDLDSTTYNDCRNEAVEFLNRFAGIAIDMSHPYKLEVYKTGPESFKISLTNLKYKDIVKLVELFIEIE